MGLLLADNDDTPHLELKSYWHQSFKRIFQDFSPDEWTLEPTETPLEGSTKFPDSAKVKFDCECGNSWTSMNGQVIFWFKKIGTESRREVEIQREEDNDNAEALLVSNTKINKYSLRFMLYGQKCKVCEDKDYESPKWYREEVEKTLENVHQKIGETFYEFERKETNTRKRFGRPTQSHDSNRCQACQHGLCRR